MHRTTPTKTGLILVCEKGCTGPIFTCQSCGKRIRKASMGALVWGKSLAEGKKAAPIFLCKGEDRGFTTCLNAPQYKDLPWEQLDAFLGHLLHNTDIRSVKDCREITARSKRGV
jgi:hypothetical protein